MSIYNTIASGAEEDGLLNTPTTATPGKPRVRLALRLGGAALIALAFALGATVASVAPSKPSTSAALVSSKDDCRDLFPVCRQMPGMTVKEVIEGCRCSQDVKCVPLWVTHTNDGKSIKTDQGTCREAMPCEMEGPDCEKYPDSCCAEGCLFTGDLPLLRHGTEAAYDRGEEPEVVLITAGIETTGICIDRMYHEVHCTMYLPPGSCGSYPWRIE